MMSRNWGIWRFHNILTNIDCVHGRVHWGHYTCPQLSPLDVKLSITYNHHLMPWRRTKWLSSTRYSKGNTVCYDITWLLGLGCLMCPYHWPVTLKVDDKNTAAPCYSAKQTWMHLFFEIFDIYSKGRCLMWIKGASLLSSQSTVYLLCSTVSNKISAYSISISSAFFLFVLFAFVIPFLLPTFWVIRYKEFYWFDSFRFFFITASYFLACFCS